MLQGFYRFLCVSTVLGRSVGNLHVVHCGGPFPKTQEPQNAPVRETMKMIGATCLALTFYLASAHHPTAGNGRGHRGYSLGIRDSIMIAHSFQGPEFGPAQQVDRGSTSYAYCTCGIHSSARHSSNQIEQDWLNSCWTKALSNPAILNRH